MTVSSWAVFEIDDAGKEKLLGVIHGPNAQELALQRVKQCMAEGKNVTCRTYDGPLREHCEKEVK